MSKHRNNTDKAAAPVERALPGNPPSSPNAPANMDAAARASAAEQVAINNQRAALRNAVASGEHD